MYEPFDIYLLQIQELIYKSKVVVSDGEGNEYINIEACKEVNFIIAGALGTHNIYYFDQSGNIIDNIKFIVDCETTIEDEGGLFNILLNRLHYTMIHWNEANNCFYEGKIYKYFVSWLRDHVHTLKGMKYFSNDLKSAIELYKNSQREDGMIFDNVETREGEYNYWEQRFKYGDFIKISNDNKIEFKRIPVENDVEYLFVEGIYYTWKATGDNIWMQGMLESAIKAYKYSMKDAYRWSQKYGLLKRGYTIDTWDFQNSYDTKVTGDPMAIDKEKSNFGIMHGDNTGFIAGCRYISEMLKASGREDESIKYDEIATQMKKKLDSVSWNGKFFTHHVSEKNVIRDFGIDTSKQISLSNAYALNRGINQEQKESIIKTYLEIKESLPQNSPGEWYAIYPPFEKGYEAHNDKWDYMNGGVLSITAGELAHGAFESGFEKYGVDILERINKLAEKHDGYLNCCFKGSISEPQKEGYTTIDLKKYANADICGKGSSGVPGWTGEGENDIHEIPYGTQKFKDIPFDIPNPELNGRKACIALKNSIQYAHKIKIDLKTKAKSIYLLHTMSGGIIAGSYTLKYDDGTEVTRYVTRGNEIQGWWFPIEDKSKPIKYVVAWEGKNALCKRIGVVIYGFNNPYPEKNIESLVFESAKDDSFWAIFGITLSDKEVNLNTGDVSFGIPDNWGAAAVVYSLIEGLAGIVDKDISFKKVQISPRWTSARVNNCKVTVKYPSSNGYVKYSYNHLENEGIIKIVITGNGTQLYIHCLLPEKAIKIESLKVNEINTEYKLCEVRQSKYVDFNILQKGITTIYVQYK